jgi:uncharacterized membrane protein YedE/YeeE
MSDDFLVWPALGGGILIGASALILYLFNGRIAGISGITGSVFGSQGHEFRWRALFVAGLILGGLLLTAITGNAPNLQFQSSTLVTVIAGLLVGYGTRLGSGCTSGHGVCGLARLSRRSLASLLIFMGIAVLTVFFKRHVFIDLELN